MASEVNRYRYFCQTESNYVYKWDTKKPTTCVNNVAHTIDSNSITIIDSVANQNVSVNNFSLSAFDELRVAEKTTVFDIKSFYGKSSYRDTYDVTGTAAISNVLNVGQYELYVSGANDTAVLTSVERGKYIAGLMGEAGIGVRIPQTLQSNQFIRFGLYDDSNGFFFLYNKDGLNVGRRKAGVDFVTSNTQLNIDKLDGNGPSKVVYNPTNGYIHDIRFSWYGYGVIEYSISTQTKGGGAQTGVLIHRMAVSNETSIASPNLPLRAEIRNNGTSGSNALYISGRQYSLIGKFTPTFRPCASYVNNVTVNSGVFVPIMSIRKKVGFFGTHVRIKTADVIVSTTQLVQIRSGGTLTGAVWGDVPNQEPTETCIEFDSTSSAISGGQVLWTGLMDPNTNTFRGIDNIEEFSLQEARSVSVCIQNLGNAGTVSTALRWVEEW